jgi:hypothetical protein
MFPRLEGGKGFRAFPFEPQNRSKEEHSMRGKKSVKHVGKKRGGKKHSLKLVGGMKHLGTKKHSRRKKG